MPDKPLCDAVTCLLAWFGYAVTKLAETPNSRAVIETIMKRDLRGLARHERWSMTALRASESVSFLTTRLDSGRGNDLTRELWGVRCMEEPAQIWSADALRSFCQTLSLLELQLPELESTLVSLGATWDGGDPRLWAETASLLLGETRVTRRG